MIRYITAIKIDQWTRYRYKTTTLMITQMQIVIIFIIIIVIMIIVTLLITSHHYHNNCITNSTSVNETNYDNRNITFQ